MIHRYYLILLFFLFSTILGKKISLQPPKYSQASKKLLQLDLHQSLNLQLSSAIKIFLNNNNSAIKEKEKLHSLTTLTNHDILQIQQNKKNSKEWNISIGLKIVQGDVAVYFCTAYGGLVAKKSDIGSQQTNHHQEDEFQGCINQDFMLYEGINLINSTTLKTYLKNHRQDLNFAKPILFLLPKQKSKVILHNGPPQIQISSIGPNQPILITAQRQTLQLKAYKLLNYQSQYIIKFLKKKGRPIIKLYRCNEEKDQIDCFYRKYHVPYFEEEKDQDNYRKKKEKNLDKYLVWQVKEMLEKSQQYFGQLDVNDENSHLYLIIQTNSTQQVELQIILYSPDYALRIPSNIPIKDYLSASSHKTYKIQLNNSSQKQQQHFPKQSQKQKSKVIIQVLEGNVQITISKKQHQKQQQNDQSFSPTQTNGLIQILLDQQAGNVYEMVVQAIMRKDASYSIWYYSSDYKMYINDGYPNSHIIKPSQPIKLVYVNDNTSSKPITLSLSIIQPYPTVQQPNKQDQKIPIKLKIYTYQTYQAKKTQYITIQDLNELMNALKYFIMQIPDNYSKIQFVMENNGNQHVQISLLLSDQQIIVLPIGYGLPLWVDSDKGASILIDNLQKGHIQLLIKKCDDSDPQIAYSLNPIDFINGIYDYQTMQQIQHIFKSNIKVTSLQNLYIRLTASSQQTNSLIHVSTNYIKGKQSISQQKLQIQEQKNSIKKGNHGEINYQLITNQKAEIWFKQVQCLEDCRRNTVYQMFWSTDRGELFRSMVCPGCYLYKHNINGDQHLQQQLREQTQQIQSPIVTDNYKITTKPGRDGIIAVTHILTNPIIYVSVIATNQPNTSSSSSAQLTNQLIYQDIQIVNISGQLSRVSMGFFVIIAAVIIIGITLALLLVKKHSNKGYKPVKTFQGKKDKQTEEEEHKVI